MGAYLHTLASIYTTLDSQAHNTMATDLESQNVLEQLIIGIAPHDTNKGSQEWWECDTRSVTGPLIEQTLRTY